MSRNHLFGLESLILHYFSRAFLNVPGLLPKPRGDSSYPSVSPSFVPNRTVGTSLFIPETPCLRKGLFSISSAYRCFVLAILSPLPPPPPSLPPTAVNQISPLHVSSRTPPCSQSRLDPSTDSPLQKTVQPIFYAEFPSEPPVCRSPTIGGDFFEVFSRYSPSGVRRTLIKKFPDERLLLRPPFFFSSISIFPLCPQFSCAPRTRKGLLYPL